MEREVFLSLSYNLCLCKKFHVLFCFTKYNLLLQQLAFFSIELTLPTNHLLFGQSLSTCLTIFKSFCYLSG